MQSSMLSRWGKVSELITEEVKQACIYMPGQVKAGRRGGDQSAFCNMPFMHFVIAHLEVHILDMHRPVHTAHMHTGTHTRTVWAGSLGQCTPGGRHPPLHHRYRLALQKQGHRWVITAATSNRLALIPARAMLTAGLTCEDLFL